LTAVAAAPASTNRTTFIVKAALKRLNFLNIERIVMTFLPGQPEFGEVVGSIYRSPLWSFDEEFS
jgi:hypothetical protein